MSVKKELATIALMETFRKENILCEIKILFWNGSISRKDWKDRILMENASVEKIFLKIAF